VTAVALGSKLPGVTSSPTPAALSAFLKGIEPRADVLARAQAGPALDSPCLLAEVRAEFSARAPKLPLAEWPLRYWGLLLAREELARPLLEPAGHPLYRLAHTRRLAVLLRLVVGLEPPGAARVMGLSETAYRALWSDAQEKLEENGVGPAVLQRWNEAFQTEVRGVGSARSNSAAKASSRPRKAAWRLPWRPNRLQAGLGLVALLLLVLLAASFVWPPMPQAPASPTAVQVPAALQPSQAAAPAKRNLQVELVVDPDFGLLGSSPTDAWHQGVGFFSWRLVRNGGALPATASAEWSSLPSEWALLAPETQQLLRPVQAAWPTLETEMRTELQLNAARWQAMSTEERLQRRDAYAAWLQRPALERADLRSRFAAWSALSMEEREALESEVSGFAALPADEQQKQRESFAALSLQEQRDWDLGPRLGSTLPGLRPLLAFVPAAEQVLLVDALQALPDADREALATRVAAMGTAQRAALRGRVLAAAPEQRLALLVQAAERAR